MLARRLAVLGAALALCVSVSGCGSRIELVYVADGNSYAQSDLETLLATADLDAASEIAAADTADARNEVLAQLRQHGDESIRLADTLTAEFPVDVAAVPVIVEDATYEGEPAWIVIEVWGDTGGTLVHRRLWVFSKSDQSVRAAQSQQ